MRPKDKQGGYRVDEHVKVACPSSIVLETLERYFRDRRNVPIVVVEAHPNRSFLGRYNDRLEISWHPAEDDGVSFVGRFTIAPEGAGTELSLQGSYQTAMLSSDLDVDAAQAMCRVLLDELKAVLQEKFETYTTAHVRV